MKIGIITIHRSQNNYGAALQAFALWKYVTSLGFDCEIIDLYRPIHPGFQASRGHLPLRKKKKRVIKSFFNKIKSLFLKDNKPNTKRILTPEAVQRFEEFNSLIKYSHPYFSVDSLYDNPPEYDVYITGSDQVWNPTMPYCIEPYFLNFVTNGGRKLSYAASIGISELLPEENSSFRRWLSSYDAISVREKTGSEKICEITGRDNVIQVCDPTFLLEKEAWLRISTPPSVSSKYLLLFTLSFNSLLFEYAMQLKLQSGLELVYLSYGNPVKLPDDCHGVSDAGPREFLGYLNSAEMVITDSFHGTALSLILQANNFYSYISPKNNRGSRITDLLDTYNLSSHLLNPELSTTYDELSSNNIDWLNESLILDKEREYGRSFLKKHLV